MKAVAITNIASAPVNTRIESPMSGNQLTPKRFKELDQLCNKLGVTCGRMGLVHEALSHSSSAVETPGAKDNERLEFFGDAVLRFVISEYLLERFPDYDEGKLTELRSVLVSDKVLAEIAQEIGLSKYILLGQKVQMRPSIMAQAMEALIGAIYQDLGLFHVQTLLVRLFGNPTTIADRDEVKDNFKAQLQEFTQSRGQGLPCYQVLETEGPPHDPTFKVSVEIAGQIIASASGKSKKAAEQEAARLAYEKVIAS
ncbi:MAG TPA: ribonuclease III [Candidatus Obscuribacter sp.]|nr:ribonuclease III [Candidatus Obscuribacter sp.]